MVAMWVPRGKGRSSADDRRGEFERGRAVLSRDRGWERRNLGSVEGQRPMAMIGEAVRDRTLPKIRRPDGAAVEKRTYSPPPPRRRQAPVRGAGSRVRLGRPRP